VQDSKAIVSKNAIAKQALAKAPVGTPAINENGSPASKVDKVGTGAYGTRPGEQRLDVSGASSIKSFHKGGRVQKDGPANLKKGEHVLNARQTAQFDMARKTGTWHALAGMDQDNLPETDSDHDGM
jgi:hypothetical protein